MTEIELSDNAKRLLKHFQDQNMREGDFQYSDPMEKLFQDAEDCEIAQAELARLGLLELGPARSKFDSSGVSES